ncbi:SWIM zinc finger family protein [Sphaerisporangium dianthi]|uniref:SWIM zinc finger family protein n=1 Tax=Sphaerisporangium dianthi TaxID=1436120 RepID=A0ABV9CET6_9ACTN
MIERWSREQVLALAPDASSQKGAQSVSTPAKWSTRGVMSDVLWGECKGSGATPYRACVDLAEPAYRCSCPSRKFPCKHALGLLLLWSADGVPAAEAFPGWVTEWVEQRRARAAKAAASRGGGSPADPGATGHGPGDDTGPGQQGAGRDPAAGDDQHGSGANGGDAGAGPRAGGPGSADGAEVDRRAAQRETRVAAGLSELERWLADQIGQGLAGARQNAPAQWDELTRRLVDAQAPGVAGVVSRLPRVLAEEDWPARLLGEYGLLHLLAVGFRRARELPAPLCDTIRSRVGFPASREEVLAGAALRDHWHVLGARDEEQDRLISRRVWLRGSSSGRSALVLSFAPPGQALDASLVTGTTIDADLAFYPGAAPLRALIAVRHRAVPPGPPPGVGVRAVLDELAAALAADPWLESWPVVLNHVIPVKQADRWLLADAEPETGVPGGGVSEAHFLDGGVPEAGRAEGAPPAGTGAGAGVRGGAPAPGSERAPRAGQGPGAGVVEGMPLQPSGGVPWRLLAVSGGHPVNVAAEWTPRGLRPLTTWDEEGQVVVL